MNRQKLLTEKLVSTANMGIMSIQNKMKLIGSIYFNE